MAGIVSIALEFLALREEDKSKVFAGKDHVRRDMFGKLYAQYEGAPRTQWTAIHADGDHVIVEANWRESKSFVESLDWRNQLERLGVEQGTETAEEA